ncbi:hypothetical protein UFOVP119_61 [uncultured Caudovirales phage]|uniref:Uncharacterized protein n=1 Tax=uncultured Caudovirales phage TaxID=2100421 RepID=A0A6J5LBG5_9CAUD|nr:hypothetical protein UFOVP119_61 [uncultured Caudovirales phage]
MRAGVGELPERMEGQLDMIDAAFFSGDTFHSEPALRRFEWYVARWQREAVNIRAMINDARPDSEGGET